jgi:hypothetical protein
MCFTEDQDEIQTIAPEGSDQRLDTDILPRLILVFCHG